MAQKYKVVKRYRTSGRKVTLQSNLTEAEAQKIVRSFPDRVNTMVTYTKQ